MTHDHDHHHDHDHADDHATDGEGVSVEASEQSPVVQRISVEVDASRVSRAFDRAYSELGRQARVKGFRPGKVPRSVLKRMYAGSLGEQIEGSLVAETLPAAIEKAGINPVSEPSIDARPPEEGAVFRYTADVEVKPVFTLPDLDGLPAKRPSIDLAEADVDAQLENLRQHSAPVVEEPEGTPVADGHILSVDFVGRIDGEPFEGGTGRGVTLEIGSGRFIPGFEEQLVGAEAGDDLEIRVTFPDDYSNEEVRGKEAVFASHVEEIKRRQVPELDDEFAKDLGEEFESLEDLRTRIRSDLASEREQASKTELRRTLMDALIERTPFPVPPRLVDRQRDRQLEAAARRLQGQVPPEALQSQIDRWREEWRPRAERELREVLLLEAVATQQSLEVGDEDLDTAIAAEATSQGMEPAQLRKAYEEGGAIDGFRAQLLERKALEFLIARAKVEETTDT
jgi:trigger factor